MKIFEITVVKDEIDVIHEFLDSTIHWANKIFIYDNGSTDGTWEAINERADSQIVIYKRSEEVFSDRIRGEIYRSYRRESGAGDWWAIADADEFYLEDPRIFLSRVKWPFHSVYGKFLLYVIAKEDVDEKLFGANFRENIKHIKYLEPFIWSERRFFRERCSGSWPADRKQPVGAHLICPRMIPCAHYRLRSPHQAQKRFKNRMELKLKTEEKIFSHVRGVTWKDQLQERSKLVYDAGPATWNNLKIMNKPRYLKIAMARILHNK